MNSNRSPCRSCKFLEADYTGAICVGCMLTPKTFPNYERAGNTRLDLIKAMSARDLAELIYKLGENSLYCVAAQDFSTCWNSDCRECIVRWLNESIEEVKSDA